MVQATNLGYPRIGKSRELKKALEQYWSGNLSETMLLEQAASLRKQHWLLSCRAVRGCDDCTNFCLDKVGGIRIRVSRHSQHLRINNRNAKLTFLVLHAHACTWRETLRIH